MRRNGFPSTKNILNYFGPPKKSRNDEPDLAVLQSSLVKLVRQLARKLEKEERPL